MELIQVLFVKVRARSGNTLSDQHQLQISFLHIHPAVPKVASRMQIDKYLLKTLLIFLGYISLY